MAKRPETLEEWLARYEAKQHKAFVNYQDSGEPKYDRQIEEYELICDGIRALIERKEERNADIKKRIVNRDYVIDQLLKPAYSRAEVVKMLHEAVYW